MSSGIPQQGEIARFTNGDGFQLLPAGTLFDPVDVVLLVKSPSGTVTDESASVQTSGTGLYYADIQVDEAGIYEYQWDGDQVMSKGSLYVQSSLELAS